MKLKNLAFVLLAVVAVPAFAQHMSYEEAELENMSVEETVLDELNPYDADINEQLTKMDEVYEYETGLASHLPRATKKDGCSGLRCAVFIDVNKSTQSANVYVYGQLKHSWRISSGLPSHPTPNFNTHPNGRIYDAYMSRTYPGGDYNGLGNMPYAVFISGGFALHGTGRSNWPKLGTRASHGCIRQHPDNAKIFNRLVRSVGVANTWVSVHN